MSEFGNFNVHPFANEFLLLEGEAFAALVADIARNGLREPIALTADGLTIVDGRNRYRACLAAGCQPMFRRLSEMDDSQLIEYIVSANLQRREMNVGQRALHALSVAAKRDTRTNKAIAQIGGVKPRAIAQAKRIAVDDAMRVAVSRGEVPLNTAFRRLQSQQLSLDFADHPPGTIDLYTFEGTRVQYPRSRSKPLFNQTNEQISWAGWSWNPVTGCMHNCVYCYAREIAVASPRHFPSGFNPTFHDERLEAPANTKVPADATSNPRRRRVFVCSMADLYGKWVTDSTINLVHQACISNPQWEYLFLTKFPQRYLQFTRPPSAWLGTTVDTQSRVKIAEDTFRQINDVRVRWLSLEPLLEPLVFSDLSMFDWVVIGAQTRTRQPADKHHAEPHIVEAFAPPVEWVFDLIRQARQAGCRIWLKENLLGRVTPRSPGMALLQESPI